MPVVGEGMGQQSQIQQTCQHSLRTCSAWSATSSCLMLMLTAAALLLAPLLTPPFFAFAAAAGAAADATSSTYDKGKTHSAQRGKNRRNGCTEHAAQGWVGALRESGWMCIALVEPHCRPLAAFQWWGGTRGLKLTTSQAPNVVKTVLVRQALVNDVSLCSPGTDSAH
jgi:hypothetical protein